jgi:hypothetical protein
MTNFGIEGKLTSLPLSAAIARLNAIPEKYDYSMKHHSSCSGTGRALVGGHKIDSGVDSKSGRRLARELD